jgi:hypothetical protein
MKVFKYILVLNKSLHQLSEGFFVLCVNQCIPFHSPWFLDDFFLFSFSLCARLAAALPSSFENSESVLLESKPCLFFCAASFFFVRFAMNIPPSLLLWKMSAELCAMGSMVKSIRFLDNNAKKRTPHPDYCQSSVFLPQT